MAAILDRLSRVGRAMARELTARWGPPDARDSIVSLWDLDRVRRELAAAAAPVTPAG
jgi:hypothetical protein